MFLSRLASQHHLHAEDYEIKDLERILSNTIDLITDTIGPHSVNDNDPPTETFLTVLLTDGKNMLAYQGGKDLYYSTHKRLCSERDSCPSFGPSCEQPTKAGTVNHLLISSEPIEGENVWNKLRPGDIVGVNSNMNFAKCAL